jgi:putative NADH-flavin reductase
VPTKENSRHVRLLAILDRYCQHSGIVFAYLPCVPVKFNMFLNMNPTIAVIGATGNQGGAVARSLLQNTHFKVRAITRNASSEAAKALASAGAEVAEASGFNHQEMVAALQSVSGLYVNINSDDRAWKNPDSPTEFDLGKAIVDAAVEAGVQNLVYSGGPPCTQMTGGKVSMKAMDSKLNGSPLQLSPL